MKKTIKLFVASFAVAVFGFLAVAPVATVAAYDPFGQVDCSGGGDACDKIQNTKGADNLIGTIISTLLFVIGALSVIMIIVAGIMYVTSTGDSGKVTRAKNTLTYSIVGLVVAFLAYAIVFWVLGVFK